MSATYYLFPDAREGEDPVGLVNMSIDVRNKKSKQYHYPFAQACQISRQTAWVSYGPITSDNMVDMIVNRDWFYPVLLVYRTDEDNRWSYMTLGVISPIEKLGDE